MESGDTQEIRGQPARHDQTEDTTCVALPEYFSAFGALEGWIEGATSLTLLDTALSSGILHVASQGTSAAAIATGTGLPHHRVEALCEALHARGVLDASDGLYEVTPPFALLMSPEAPQPLSVYLVAQRVTQRMLINCLEDGGDYGALEPDELIAMAKSVTMDPGTALGAAMAAQLRDAFPEELKTVWAAGATHLELGCGVGGGVLELLLSHPAVAVVGIEREAVLLDEARRRASDLGVADRVEWRAMDARDLSESGTFDTVTWSQFFFPLDTRLSTLSVARRALKPGGYLCMPILPERPNTVEEMRGPSGRAYTLARLTFGSWEVPILGARELEQEVDGAGFETLGVFDAGFGRLLVARKPSDP